MASLGEITYTIKAKADLSQAEAEIKAMRQRLASATAGERGYGADALIRGEVRNAQTRERLEKAMIDRISALQIDGMLRAAKAREDALRRELAAQKQISVAMEENARRDLAAQKQHASALDENARRDLQYQKMMASAIAENARLDLSAQRQHAVAMEENARRDLQFQRQHAIAIEENARREQQAARAQLKWMEDIIHNRYQQMAAQRQAMQSLSFGAGAWMAGAGAAGMYGMGRLGQVGLQSYGEFDLLVRNMQALLAVERVQAGMSRTVGEAFQFTGEQAKTLANWTERLAIISPFTSDDIKKAMQMGMGFGYTSEQAKRMTKDLVDWAAATGKTGDFIDRAAYALGQMAQAGKLTGLEMRQMTEAGLNPLRYLQKEFGATRQELVKMISDGLIPADRAFKAIMGGIESDYGGAAERFADSWQGLVTSFQELYKINLRDFFQGTGEALRPVMKELVGTLGSPEFRNNLKETGAALGAIAGILARMAGFTFSQLATLPDGLKTIGLLSGGVGIGGLGAAGSGLLAANQYMQFTDNLKKMGDQGIATAGMINTLGASLLRVAGSAAAAEVAFAALYAIESKYLQNQLALSGRGSGVGLEDQFQAVSKALRDAEDAQRNWTVAMGEGGISAKEFFKNVDPSVLAVVYGRLQTMNTAWTEQSTNVGMLVELLRQYNNELLGIKRRDMGGFGDLKGVENAELGYYEKRAQLAAKEAEAKKRIADEQKRLNKLREEEAVRMAGLEILLRDAEYFEVKTPWLGMRGVSGERYAEMDRAARGRLSDSIDPFNQNALAEIEKMYDDWADQTIKVNTHRKIEIELMQEFGQAVGTLLVGSFHNANAALRQFSRTVMSLIGNEIMKSIPGFGGGLLGAVVGGIGGLFGLQASGGRMGGSVGQDRFGGSTVNNFYITESKDSRQTAQNLVNLISAGSPTGRKLSDTLQRSKQVY